MSSIGLNNGCLSLLDNDQFIPLSAEEIYSVNYENLRTIQNVQVSKEDFLSTGIEFRNYAADPVVVLTTAIKDFIPTVFCDLIAKGIGFEARISRFNGNLLDYAISNQVWMPLPYNTIKTANAFLNEVGISDFGPISLNQYLKIINICNPEFKIDDRTHEAFSAKQFANSLVGELPQKFIGKLYPYQEAGYKWLSFMRKNTLGCIIADEMGLGKTIQVICLLLEAKNDNCGPILIITPATLIENWRRELHRFAPSLSILIHRGAHRTGFPEDLRSHDVVMCSYDTAVTDISLLNNLKWDIVVLDEAQAIKNPLARRTNRIKTISRNYSIAMSGTPIENHLIDIWSITDFAIPTLLGTRSDFERNHPDTISGATSLEPILSPVILRRTVSEVGKDLPERIEIPQPLELDQASAEIYDVIRQSAQSQNGSSLASLVKLRMFCAHPWLADEFTNYGSALDCSVKLRRLIEILEEIVDSGGKALVFTSYQESIDILTAEIASRYRIMVSSIDGRTPMDKRQKIVDQFSEIKQPAVLVLNPKAAGTGLNITAANHVIHYNLEWNPAVEDQATARSYRRGQIQSVTVHRLFYVNTVEEVINDRMGRKRELATTAVIGSMGGEPDMQDILRALRISPKV